MGCMASILVAAIKADIKQCGPSLYRAKKLHTLACSVRLMSEHCTGGIEHTLPQCDVFVSVGQVAQAKNGHHFLVGSIFFL